MWIGIFFSLSNEPFFSAVAIQQDSRRRRHDTFSLAAFDQRVRLNAIARVEDDLVA